MPYFKVLKKKNDLNFDMDAGIYQEVGYKELRRRETISAICLKKMDDVQNIVK